MIILEVQLYLSQYRYLRKKKKTDWLFRLIYLFWLLFHMSGLPQLKIYVLSILWVMILPFIWDWTKESTEVEERCCTDQIKYNILQQSTASSTNVQNGELACKLCSVQILRVHLYHCPICIITFLKQTLKQCRHCFQINVAISKHISFLANSTLILLEVCLCGSTPKRTKNMNVKEKTETSVRMQ